MSKQELEVLSYKDLVRKVGGTPDKQRPVIFVPGQTQFESPGIYAQNPRESIPVYAQNVESMEEIVEQREVMTYGYNDVAVCMTRVLLRCEGGVARSVKANRMSLPQEMRVETGYDRDGVMQYETVPGDWMTIPGFNGRCRAVANSDGTGTLIFQYQRFDQDAINGLFDYIRDELKERSIYRGQIITSQYQYVNVANFDRSQVVFNADIQEAVKVACISPIIDLEELLLAGEKAKRSVLLSGPPGTGKTLLFNTTQSTLFEMGFTGIIIPPGSSAAEMAKGLQMARNYMTSDSIVGLFVEDIEKMALRDRELALDNLDGSVAKTDRVLIMMTTNFPEKIDGAFLRQGRVDDYIEVGLPDLDAFTRLIKQRLGNRLADDVDFERAFEAFADYTPAWIVGGMSKVVRTVIARTHSHKDITVTTQDLVTIATLMRRQWELQDEATKRPEQNTSFEDSFREMIRQGFAEAAMNLNDLDYGNVYAASIEAIENKLDGGEIQLQTETGKPIEGQLRTT